VKFCPGSQLPLGSAKFCPNCGKSLWDVSESVNTIEEKPKVQSASPAETVLDCALPITTGYNDVTKLGLVNEITDVETTLNLHPYYLFEYQADVKKGLLRRSETECGHRIVDATNKKIIQASEDDAKYTKYTQSFFSKENDQNQDEELEEMDQMEKTQIIEELD